MKIAEILRRKGSALVTIRPDDTLQMAAGVLTAKGIGALVVVDAGERLVGIVSERDFVQAYARHKEEMLRYKVADVMTRDVITCTPDDAVKDIMALITHRRIRHVPVTQGGRLVGIVSIGDVLKSRLDEAQQEMLVLRDISLARG